MTCTFALYCDITLPYYSLLYDTTVLCLRSTGRQHVTAHAVLFSLFLSLILLLLRNLRRLHVGRSVGHRSKVVQQIFR